MVRVDRGFLRSVAILLLLASFATAQQPPRGVSEALPQDTGAAGLRQMLVRLHTTARLMHTTAHPDDEDGGMLTMQSRGRGASTVLFTLTRGEGGQNKVGSNLFDELGVLRTLELLASDRYYGVEQRFSRVADFGYSKSAKETFEKWNGHETALGDMVRVIRTFRPDVLVSRFQGTSRDGHGHHEAAGVLVREAFRAAGDPKRFLEQLSEGLLPWQPKKLYVSNRGSNDYTVQFDTGTNDAALGMSYREFAMQGLRHQLSQGADAWRAGPGRYLTSYKLADSALTSAGGSSQEQDFFDGMDTTLVGLAKRIPQAERSKGAFLSTPLQEIHSEIEKATAAATNPASAVEPLLRALRSTNELIGRVEKSGLSEQPRVELLTALETKREQLNEAARLALGLKLETSIENGGSELVVPGQRFAVKVRVRSDVPIEVTGLRLRTPKEWKLTPPTNSGGEYRFEVTVPNDAVFTRPYYHRDDPEHETIYTIDEPEFATLPLTPPPLQAALRYSYRGLEGTTGAVVETEVKTAAGEKRVPVAVAPAASVLIEPVTRVVPSSQHEPTEVVVKIRSNVPNLRDGVLQLRAQRGWRVQPASHPVTIEERGAEKQFRFFLFPVEAPEGRYQLRATLSYEGQDFEQGYSVVTRNDLGTGYYYQPATGRISVVNVKIPDNLVVGYVMGAGDDIPNVLRQVGINLKMITPEELASGDLQKYGTIILGIRAYDTREDVRKHNQRLLDYCAKGGTLVVQYNASAGDFNGGKFTPYPAEIGRERVSVEDAPIELLDPNDDIFDFPNEITPKDFDGWVQERGLYFMQSWDNRYRPLMASHDPGETPMKGGLLRAPYEKGTYIYTGYSFFRQLPHGIPGAIRLFVNIVGAGHEDGR